MEQENRYFIVEGGKLKEIIDGFFSLRVDQQKARSALCKKYGTTKYYADSKKVFSFKFDDSPVPSGWVYDSKSGGYKPNLRTKEGKAEVKSWNLALGDACDLTYSIIGCEDPFHFMDSSMRCRFMEVETISGKRILKVPKIAKPRKGECGEDGYKWEPLDNSTREIKASEYWALKENESKTE